VTEDRAWAGGMEPKANPRRACGEAGDTGSGPGPGGCSASVRYRTGCSRTRGGLARAGVRGAALQEGCSRDPERGWPGRVRGGRRAALQDGLLRAPERRVRRERALQDGLLRDP